MSRNLAEVRHRALRNTLQTGFETARNMSITPLVLAGVAALGLHGVTPPLELIHAVQNQFLHGPEPFMGGLGAGFLQNALLIGLSLRSLEGKTRHGTLLPLYRKSDGTFVAQITCVDARRTEKSGGAMPGSYAVLGAELSSAIQAALISAMMPNPNPIVSAAAGYALGSNILTGLQAHAQLIDQIKKIVNQAHIQDPTARVETIMENHWNGCGAEGFTSIAAYLAKFKFHNPLHLADLLAIPNEVLGFAYVNTLLSPIVAVTSGGQVSLTASVRHSAMNP